MKAKSSALLTLGLLGLACSPVVAQEPVSKKQSFWTDYHRNNLWPNPFRAEDTIAVQTAFDIQRNNGWRLYNTLGNPMFEPGQQKLTDAGKTHIRWILTQAPAGRRVIFVLKGTSAEETAQRIESTQLAVSEILPVGTLPPIYVTDTAPTPSSGVYQTAIHRAMVESTPSPRLAPQSSGGGTP